MLLPLQHLVPAFDSLAGLGFSGGWCRLRCAYQSAGKATGRLS